MSRRSPSIEDIARVAGVANSTVSRALRDSPLISREVREQIQRIASEMGYMPNGIAQSLQNQRSNTIGLVVTSIADPFFADVARGVEKEAQAAGLSVFLSTSHQDAAREIVVIETFQRRRVDGIIVADSQISKNYTERLRLTEMPTVLINSQTEESSSFLHSVAVDDYAGARLAVEHLIALGHRAIGHISVSSRPRSGRRRFEGYRDALLEAGITLDPAWSLKAPPDSLSLDDDVITGQTLLPALLAAKVSAVFCYNDMVATGVLMACRERSIAIPQQLSVVGFDDIAIAQYITPPLTTIQQPKIQLGKLAMQTLLDLLHNRPTQDHLIAPSLVQRASAAVYHPENLA